MIETENITVQAEQTQEPQPRKRQFGRKICAVILVLLFIFSRGYAVHQFTNSVSATITINSISSTNGKNPDGTPFNIMELFNDATLNKAVEKLNGKMSAEEIRKHLTVNDTLAAKSVNALEQSIFDGEEENVYFPNQYVITYSTVSEQIKYEGLLSQCKSLWRSIFLPTKAKILTAVLESYVEYYSEVHLNYEALFDIDWDTIDAMDYYNRFDSVQKTVRRFQRFLGYKNSQSLSGNNENNAKGYYDLSIKLTQGASRSIDNFQAYITQHGVTNDKYELLRQFAYMQKYFEEEYIRKTQEYNVLREAIEMYDASTTKVVFIPALDGENSFYMNRTKVGIDYLSEKADAAKLSADSANYSVNLYIYLQECFSNDYIIDEQGNKKWLKNTQEERAHANELYVALKQEIRDFAVELQLLTEESNALQQDGLVVSKVRHNFSVVSFGMTMAKRYALILTGSFVVVCASKAIAELSQKKRSEDNE